MDPKLISKVMQEMGPQGRQKGWEKGSENEGSGFNARAAESDCPKSRKESMGESKEEQQRVLKFGDSGKLLLELASATKRCCR